MFKRLLIPLDGSALAETVLPAARWFAESFGAAVLLIHVVEPHAPSTVHQERHLQDAADAQQYLARIASEVFGKAIDVTTHVHERNGANVADRIADHADEYASELIFMADHGEHGPSRWISGSLAQKVAGIDTTPIFLLRPRPGYRSDASWSCRSLMVPLDCSGEHERALDIAAIVAAKAGASVELVNVVDTYTTISGPFTNISRLLPGSTVRLLDVAAEEATIFLQKRQALFSDRSISSTIQVARGDPAKVIVARARETAVDCVVVGTHAKRGLDAFWSGSVVSKICSSCDTPLLLVPVG